MRSLAAALALFAAPCLAQLPSGTTIVNDLEHIALINSIPKSTWEAAPQRFFEGQTFDSARRLLGVALSSTPTAHGRALSAVWGQLTSVGVATESCVPSVASDKATPSCATECIGIERFQRTRAASSYALAGAASMQDDIMRHGPIQAAFEVYKSFLVYSSGIYQKHFWEALPEGGHAVRILGWGSHKKKAYWLAANSWGETWGEKGYFRILRGAASCGIEELGPPHAGLPSVRTEDFFA